MNEYSATAATAGQDTEATPSAAGGVATFRRILVNTLIANVTSNYLWFALTFWVYLETRSVLATSIVSGLYMLAVALSGTVFGAIVDAHRKKTAMLASNVVTLVTYVGAGCLFLMVPAAELVDWSGVWSWVFASLILVGGVTGQLRNIALSTTVTLLIPADRRDKANGLVGTVNGLAHMTTSIFSGLSIGLLGMGGTVAIAIALTVVSLGHLLPIRIDEPPVQRAAGGWWPPIDLRGGWLAIRAVPGLVPLILFTTFNNLVMGVFMALMDPYGLTLFSVEAWGLVLGVTSIGFMAGGAVVARFGLGRHPLRTLLLVNVMIAVIGCATSLREWQPLLVAGMFGFMAVIPIAEAAEQTILQRVVPFEKQGRVFGLAQSFESALAPVAAFAIGSLAQLLLIPYMASGPGHATFGWLLGEGDARGIALTFVTASLVMFVAVLLAFSSHAYRRLTNSYASTSTHPTPLPVAA